MERSNKEGNTVNQDCHFLVEVYLFSTHKTLKSFQFFTKKGLPNGADFGINQTVLVCKYRKDSLGSILTYFLSLNSVIQKHLEV